MTQVNWSELIVHSDVQALLGLAVREDVGSGDATTLSIFPEPERAHARILTRTDTVMCGLPLVSSLLLRFDPEIVVTPLASEGVVVPGGAPLCEITGDIRAILTAERGVLNFLMRMCGIAWATHRAVAAVPKDTAAKIYDTRKTAPGFRLLDKAAVRTGGGENHRMGLYDAVLIKDNHVAKAGSVRAAVERARARAAGRFVQVEIDHLTQLDEALSAKPDCILLDNFSLDDMRRAVEQTGGAVPLEASGGVTLERLADIARTGVQRISIGALTHTVKPADLSLEVLTA